ncbi:MAG: Ig-like domain-containing protein, partial [Oscillospiraceae bacterium]|nr:Ig-like domain-containing protein [Oscillospiraceae bacterium]
SDNYGICSNFTLDGGDTKEPVPMYTRVKADNEKIYAGGGITQVSADVYMSDGTVEKSDDIKLTSLTAEMASVNDTFSVVIGENIGTAKLSAVVTHKGVTLAETDLEIPVVENPSTPGEGKVVVYDISARLENEKTLNGENGLKYDTLLYATTDNLWEYAANMTNGKYSWDEGGWNKTTYNVDKAYTRFRQDGASGRNGLQMWTRYPTWFAIKIKVPYTGIFKPASTYWQFGGRGAGAESYLDYYLIKNDGSDIKTLLSEENLSTSSKYYIGSKRNEDSTLSSGQSFVFDEPFENTITLDEGEYYLVYKVRNINKTENYGVASNFTLDGVNCVKDFYVDIKSDIDWNEETKISVLPVRLDGTAISNGQYTVTYKSSKDIVATVSPDGTVKGVGEGNANITVTIDDGIGSITKTVPVTVTDTTGMNDIIYNLGEKLYVNQKVLLDIDAVMNSENILDIPAEYISYDYSPEGVITISGGIMTALTEGDVTVTTEVDFRGKKITRENRITVVPDDGKTEPNIYTYKMRQNALDNAAKYDWAKKLRNNTAKSADTIVANSEIYRAQIFGEGIPRGRQLGCTGDDYYSYCRYCHANIEGEYSWSYDFINRPWQVQCGACKRLFPSNDFESFLELGLDETGLYFSVDRARQAHHEMLFHEDGSECTCEKPKVANTPEWYIFYGYGNPKGYLYNELYSEIRESNEDPWGDKITWNKETIKDEKGEVIEIIDHGADLGT